MKEKKKGKEFVHNFLIEQALMDFSIIELVSSLQRQVKEFAMQEQERVYQYAYRHLCSLEKEGCLISYMQKRKKRFIRQNKKNSMRTLKYLPFLILQDERKQAKTELATVLAEVDEYKSLSIRFPKQKQLFQSLSVQADIDSAYLIGKINALSKTLSVSGFEKNGMSQIEKI